MNYEKLMSEIEAKRQESIAKKGLRKHIREAIEIGKKHLNK